MDEQQDELLRVTALLPSIEELRAGSPDLMALQSAFVAAPFAYLSGEEVLPLGGFTGTQPTPSTARLRADLAAGTPRLVLTLPTPDARLAQVLARCRPSFVVPRWHGHLCSPDEA